jgi:CRISPR-associated protein Cas5d
MTPSAARGVLEAIFWKPEIRWEVQDIAVLRPIKTTSLLRNEVKSKQNIGNAPFVIEEQRQQRTSLVLKDVEYVLSADLVTQVHSKDPIIKYRNQFEERVSRGQFHHSPFLGTREFAAAFEAPTGMETAIPENLDIGPMLFDLAFVPDQMRRELSWMKGTGPDRAPVPGFAEAIFFDAKLDSGHLKIPQTLYERKAALEAA